MQITDCSPPAHSQLIAFRERGAFTDCYFADVNRHLTHAEFIETFYTTRLFKLERFIIRVFAWKRSTDRQARELALGERDHFAVWKVESRAANEILLADQSGRTRSWLMAEPHATANAVAFTRLYFGSALIPRIDRRTGEQRFGLLFTALLGFHRAYSRALLRAAASQLSRRVSSQ
jgi:hypothetical protein